MVFSSITFLFVFLPIVLLAYFLLPEKCRNYCLLAASLFFYAWGEPVYVLLMLLSIAFNYVCGRELEEEENERKRKINMIFAVAADLSVLALFKYCTFLNLSLPIGISFYTFQAISYIIDVYRKDAQAQKNPLYFGLYITMFPQLIAGPIVRYLDIEEQMISRKITAKSFGIGVRRFLLGLAKKAILANGIGMVFSEITASGVDLCVSAAWLGAVAYTLQIYFDFSGYSDMAIGLGKMFGFDFNENFLQPYTSTSVTEFWRRWHVSLSTWFREYVYIPLGGNRRGTKRQIINLLIVWTLTGIWHGASLNFMFWGFYYGVILILEKFIWGKYVEKLPALLRHLYCMVLVVIGWVFFFSNTMGDALLYLKSMFGGGSGFFADNLTGSSICYHWLMWVLCIFACTKLCRRLLDKAERSRKLEWVVNVAYLLVFFIAVSCLITDSYNPFLYFRF